MVGWLWRRGEVLAGLLGVSLVKVEPSKPGEPRVDQQASIPRSREGAEEALVGEVIPKGVPLGRPYVRAEPGVPQASGAPGAPPSAGAAPPGRKKGRRLRTAMIVVGALAVGLCLGGLAVTFSWYGREATPDRSTPVITVREYLAATFDRQDPLKAAKFTCADPAEIKEIQALLQDLRDRENRFKITMGISWDGMRESITGGVGSVTANLRITAPESNGLTSESIEKWEFRVEQRSGWRVCDAHRVG